MAPMRMVRTAAAGGPRRKWPVPKGAIWWKAEPFHPVIGALGREIYHQRHERRGWSLEDLHKASGIAASHLWDVERGRHAASAEVIVKVEAAFGMARNGLMTLAWRRWEREQAEAVRGILQRE